MKHLTMFNQLKKQSIMLIQQNLKKNQINHLIFFHFELARHLSRLPDEISPSRNHMVVHK